MNELCHCITNLCGIEQKCVDDTSSRLRKKATTTTIIQNSWNKKSGNRNRSKTNCLPVQKRKKNNNKNVQYIIDKLRVYFHMRNLLKVEQSQEHMQTEPNGSCVYDMEDASDMYILKYSDMSCYALFYFSPTIILSHSAHHRCTYVIHVFPHILLFRIIQRYFIISIEK